MKPPPLTLWLLLDFVPRGSAVSHPLASVPVVERKVPGTWLSTIRPQHVSQLHSSVFSCFTLLFCCGLNRGPPASQHKCSSTELHPNSQSFLRLSNTPLCVWTRFCLSIHLSLDMWVVSTLGILRIMLLWIFGVQMFVDVSDFNSFGYIP